MSEVTSPISTIQKEALIQIIDKSNSIRDVLKHFGLDDGSYRTFYKRVKGDNISLEGLKNNWNKRLRHNELPNENVFTQNSSYSRHSIKRKILKYKLLPYICKKCNNNGTWNNKNLSLQLEHINGINDDNRLENLCFLCPNCHSQTETFAGKKKKRKINNCKICGCVIFRTSTHCKKCSNKLRNEKTKRFNITKEELENLINQKISYSKIGKMFGVTGNSIRKRCKTLGINFKRRTEA
jgi:hypothetical protein